ncbi:MAG: GyrI-like domain-containing protein [Endomicrobium sp.]|jgi:predicted transcriptional regulator YdeE|nr:GyrI-like domain-containing protein [Endomicrobium sp.]
MVEVSKKFYVVDCIRTNNFSDNLVVQKIGNLWQKVSIKIPNGVKKYGIYHDYKSDFKEDYTLSVATDIETSNKKLEFAGKYQIFDVNMNIENPIIKAWKQIWSMQINRTYTFDFEQYNPDGTVQIYCA